MADKTNNQYHPTEAKYKGGAQEMYITYDLEQQTRGGHSKIYPKVRRVYIAGDVKDWETGDIKKRSGRKVHGVAIEYEQSRKGYQRTGFHTDRGRISHAVKPTSVAGSSQRFRQVLEIPRDAQNVRFYKDARQLPEKYRSTLQNIR